MEAPQDFGLRLQRNWVKTINDELTRLKEDIDKASPVYTGALKASWKLEEANLVNEKGTLWTDNTYFPKVEAGLPKGYVVGSPERQRLIGWVMAKKGLSAFNAPFMVTKVAEKYRAVGRKGQGYVGAAPKEVPKQLGAFPKEPVKGGLIDQAFRRLDKEFKR